MTHKLQNSYTKETLPLLKKVLGPTTDFPTWGSSKETKKPHQIWLWRPVGFDYRTSTGLGKHSWRAQTKPCVHQKPGERSNDPTRDWVRLTCKCPGVSGGGLASGQTTRREQSPIHQQKIVLKIYWAWPCPSDKTQFPPHSVYSIKKLS